MNYFGCFYLDKEKDIIVNLYTDQDRMSYVLQTPNHKTGNLITNLAKICDLDIEYDDQGMKIIKGDVPCYITGDNQKLYVFRLRDTKVANIYPDGTIEKKASIPAISKTLMSQTKDYRIPFKKSIVKTYILNECKFKTDLHTHMNANLSPDILIALGIFHQIEYPLYYIKKLGLHCSEAQWEGLIEKRNQVSEQYKDSHLTGKYLVRKIDDNTFINFADLILNNLENAEYNIRKIRASLTIRKDGQAVFTNLEKVYLYRYVFCKGKEYPEKMELHNVTDIPDRDIVRAVQRMKTDHQNDSYKNMTLFQNKLLWIARSFRDKGVEYAEISDTTLVKKVESIQMLKQVHEIMPAIFEETGVRIRFLAALRRIPLTIVKDQIVTGDYFRENLEVLEAVSIDPYVAGCDIVGEEINDINDLKPVIREIVRIARNDPTFVVRIHAGENDSLRDNVYNSIQCVKDSLDAGQNMPYMRIGHGLYTANLRSKKGRELIHDILENHVVLEFQITSNVRLNNLSMLDKHPLRQYIKKGISCVQGTDGGALYGTDSIDEQLSLDKLLNLTYEEFIAMRKAEDKVLSISLKAFDTKNEQMEALMKDASLEEILSKRMDDAHSRIRSDHTGLLESEMVLKEHISQMPLEKIPVVLMGGSFNSDTHHTRLKPEDIKIIDALLDRLDPAKVFFVVGHTVQGYEKYLIENNKKGFEIYAFVPAVITKTQKKRLLKAGVNIRVSIETSPMGVYKSFAYEIFKRRVAILVAMDGNSSGANMIQEANNSRYKCRIYVDRRSRLLRSKAESLQGYLTLFDDASFIEDAQSFIEKNVQIETSGI
ncbi:MAG: hypothetical protein J6E46_03940 [Faecalicoccus sp.]|nr:hypothetical protein [Faecalicoccus sp.]